MISIPTTISPDTSSSVWCFPSLQARGVPSKQWSVSEGDGPEFRTIGVTGTAKSDNLSPTVNIATYRALAESLSFGKRLPSAVYIARPADWTSVPAALAATVERAATAALPEVDWNLLKLHIDQFAITFLSYQEFDSDPHPSLAEATRIHLGSGSIVRTDYRQRRNPPILHRKELFLPPEDPRRATFAALTAE